jgi:glyoxylase-like metal-dependent hydrolase (beta-lactamase superfamily II)
MEYRRFAMGALWTNAYLLWDAEGVAVLVDPGGDPSEALGFAEEKGLEIEWILLTHGHGDHIGGLDEARIRSRKGVAIHHADAPMLTSPEENLSRWMGSPVKSGAADKVLEDGETFWVGSMEVRVIHTPGHTAGSSCFLFREGATELLVSGDTLFTRSVGRTDLPGGSEKELKSSLVKLAALGDTLPVLPGHGPETSLGREKKENPYWP